jgi:hypothetical protein
MDASTAYTSDVISSIGSKKEKTFKKKAPDLPADRAERFFDQVFFKI